MELKLIMTLQRDSKKKPSSALAGDKNPSAMSLRWRKLSRSSKQPRENNGVRVMSMSRGKLESILCRSHDHTKLYGELYGEMEKAELARLA
jgi:hypothetical protein